MSPAVGPGGPYTDWSGKEEAAGAQMQRGAGAMAGGKGHCTEGGWNKGMGFLYCEFQDIMSNGPMGTPHEQTRQE